MNKDSIRYTDQIIVEKPEGCRSYDWINSSPENICASSACEIPYHFFVGVSDYFETESDARQNALIKTLTEISIFSGVSIDTVYKYYNIYNQEDLYKSGININQYRSKILITDNINMTSQLFSQKVKARKWCTMQVNHNVGRKTFKTSWVAYVLATIPTNEITKLKQFENFNISSKFHNHKPVTNYEQNLLEPLKNINERFPKKMEKSNQINNIDDFEKKTEQKLNQTQINKKTNSSNSEKINFDDLINVKPNIENWRIDNEN